MTERDKDEKTQKKLPLTAFIDDMPNEKHLNLGIFFIISKKVKRDFSVRQV